MAVRANFSANINLLHSRRCWRKVKASIVRPARPTYRTQHHQHSSLRKTVTVSPPKLPESFFSLQCVLFSLPPIQLSLRLYCFYLSLYCLCFEDFEQAAVCGRSEDGGVWGLLCQQINLQWWFTNLLRPSKSHSLSVGWHDISLHWGSRTVNGTEAVEHGRGTEGLKGRATKGVS